MAKDEYSRRPLAPGVAATVIVGLIVIAGILVLRTQRRNISPQGEPAAWILEGTPLTNAPATTGENAPPVAPPGEVARAPADFDPPVYRVLHDLNDHSGRASMVDLDSGRTFAAINFDSAAIPEGFLNAAEAHLHQWRTNGVDLFSDSSGKSFIAFETLIFLAARPFDETTSQQIVADTRLEGRAQTQTDVTVQRVPETYLFKTRAGERGALEVTQFSTNLESMTIRYKLVRPRWKYVRYWIILASEGSRYLSLNDAKSYLDKPAEGAFAYLEKASEWRWNLIVENAHNYSTERARGIELWDTMLPDDVAQPAGLAGLPFERTGIYPLKKDKLPVTILIPQYGLLQVSAVDDRTDQVIVDYKQVVKDGANRRP